MALVRAHRPQDQALCLSLSLDLHLSKSHLSPVPRSTPVGRSKMGVHLNILRPLTQLSYKNKRKEGSHENKSFV